MRLLLKQAIRFIHESWFNSPIIIIIQQREKERETDSGLKTNRQTQIPQSDIHNTQNNIYLTQKEIQNANFRLVSVYYNKFIQQKARWAGVIKRVIRWLWWWLRWWLWWWWRWLWWPGCTESRGLGDRRTRSLLQSFLSIIKTRNINKIYIIFRHVLSDLKKQNYLDAHWRPQYVSCPVCLLDFRSVYNVYI